MPTRTGERRAATATQGTYMNTRLRERPYAWSRLTARRSIAAIGRGRGLPGVYVFVVWSLRPPAWTGGFLGFMRPRATMSDLGRHLINPRNGERTSGSRLRTM